ncbi:MAG: hypothetical protein HZA65_03825 [Rhodocyclales bacterium]|nr:hypothetical protein [Rhodocyclales bacterium]
MSSPSPPAVAAPLEEKAPHRPTDVLTRQEHPPWASCVQAIRLKVGERHWLDVSFSLPGQMRAFVLLLETHQGALQNQALAQALGERGFGTLTACLLTPEERSNAEELSWRVNDLTERAAVVLEWLRHQPFLDPLPLAAAGWHTAAAVLIRLAAHEAKTFYALSCLEGRIDLAGAGPLIKLSVPIQLLTAVNTDDKPNTAAWPHITAEKRWERLPPPPAKGAWPEAIALTCEWFERHLPAAPSSLAAAAG